MNPDTLINRWNDLFGTEIHAIDYGPYDGRLFLVTAGTGEGVFAYDAVEFESGLNAAEAAETERYTAFCDACEAEEDEDLARTIFAELDLQICRAGSCSRVVDFDEEEKSYARWQERQESAAKEQGFASLADALSHNDPMAVACQLWERENCK